MWKKHILIVLADRTVSCEIKKQLTQNKTLEDLFVYEWGNFIKENDNNLVQIEEGDKYYNVCFRRIKYNCRMIAGLWTGRPGKIVWKRL